MVTAEWSNHAARVQRGAGAVLQEGLTGLTLGSGLLGAGSVSGAQRTEPPWLPCWKLCSPAWPLGTPADAAASR